MIIDLHTGGSGTLASMALADRLGILGLIVALFAIAATFLWPDRKWIGWLALVVAAVLLLWWGATEVKQRFGIGRMSLLVFLAVGALVGIGVAALMWFSSQVDSNSTSRKSESVLQLSDINVFSSYSTIEKGKQLAFRVSFINRGPTFVAESRMVLAVAVTDEYSTKESLDETINGLRRQARRMIAEDHSQTGPPVSIGNAITRDIYTPVFTESQAAALLNGVSHIYLLMVVSWVGQDTLRNDSEICMFLEKPHAKELNGQDLKHWGIYALPVMRASL